MRSARAFRFTALFLAGLVAARAQTTINLYRGGENDSGATNGSLVIGVTDEAGSTNLARSGSVHYSNNTPGPASTFAFTFDSGGHLTGFSALELTITASIAMEVWFNVGSVYSPQGLFYLEGIGLHFEAGQVYLALSNVPNYEIPVLLGANTWHHAALVWDNGALTGYVNGMATFFGTGLTFTTDGGAGAKLIIGQNTDGTAPLSGLIDHARIFTFATGTFNPSMLSYPASAIPEPSTYAALFGAAALGLAAWRRRARTA
jgi:hypothetical protein